MPGKTNRDTQPLGKQRQRIPLLTRRRLILIASISAILLLLAAVGAVYVLRNRPPSLPTEPGFVPPVSLEELAQEYPQFAFLLKDSEINSVYKEFLLVYQQGGPDATLKLAEERFAQC